MLLVHFSPIFPTSTSWVQRFFACTACVAYMHSTHLSTLMVLLHGMYVAAGIATPCSCASCLMIVKPTNSIRHHWKRATMSAAFPQYFHSFENLLAGPNCKIVLSMLCRCQSVQHMCCYMSCLLARCVMQLELNCDPYLISIPIVWPAWPTLDSNNTCDM